MRTDENEDSSSTGSDKDPAVGKKPKKKKKPGRIRKSLSWSFKPFVNVSAWVGFHTLVNTTNDLVVKAKFYLLPQKADEQESFEEAKQRFNLDDAQLTEKAHDFLRIAIVCAMIAAFIFFYAVYLLFTGSFGSFILACVVSCLALATAFRYHFWFFQIKSKKLGCTFQEWLDGTMGGGKQ